MIKDIAAAYSDVIKQFYDAGCRNLQLDDCTWGAVVGDAAAQRYQSLGIDIETVKEQLLKVNNLALENKPADMVITSHICVVTIIQHISQAVHMTLLRIMFLQEKMLTHFFLNMMMSVRAVLNLLQRYQAIKKLFWA